MGHWIAWIAAQPTQYFLGKMQLFVILGLTKADVMSIMYIDKLDKKISGDL